MESRKFTVHNKTRDSTLGASVASVNAALEPLKVLKVLIEGLPATSRTGLWLTNFKGVPVARTLSPFDLIYLDKDNKVLHGVELSRDGEFAPFKGRPSSALVLPSQSLTTSNTREGDQIEFTAEAVEATPAPPSQMVPATPPTAAPPTGIEATSSAPLGTTPASVPASPVTEASPSAQFFSPFPVPSSAPTEPPPVSRIQDTALPVAGSTQDVKKSATPEASSAERVGSPETRSSLRADVDREFFTPMQRAAVPKERKESESTAPLAQPATSIPRPPGEIEQPLSDSSLQISQPSARRRAAAPQTPPTQESAETPGPLTIREAPGTPVPSRPYGPPQTRNYSWRVRLLRWLFPHLVIDEPEEQFDRRRADRQSLSGLIAYYFTGGSPEPQRIGNISVTGFYLHTDERWMPGTIVRMTLQRIGTKGDDPSDTIVVNSRIVRWGPDGEGFEFILTDPEE